MSNREFTATRTMLANNMATAGAELLEYMGVSSALAAIPNTEPPQYVVAGTLAMIGKLLPKESTVPPLTAPAPLTDELPPSVAPADVVADLRAYASNPGYSHNDYADTMRQAANCIESLRAMFYNYAVAPAPQQSEGLSDDQILDAVVHIDPEDYGLPVNGSGQGGYDYVGYDLACARAIEREVLAKAAPAAPVQTERSIQGKTISEWYAAWCETSEKLKEAKACIGRYQKLVDELQTSGQPRPSVPDHIIHMIQDYGDARADDDRYAASKFGDAITAIRRLLAAPVQAEQAQAEPVNVAEMVNRFLGWKLPKDFSPDCGISFDGRGPDARGYDRGWPTGTNLFHAGQAKEMFEHCLKGAVRPTDDDLWDKTLRERDHNADMADKLAEAIGTHFGIEIGEHSNMNCPWQTALDWIENESTHAEMQAGALPAQAEQAAAVRAAALQFADDVISNAFDGGDLDGGSIQEMAEARGLITPKTMAEPCGPVCNCMEVGSEFPTTCHQKTYLRALAAPSTATSNDAGALGGKGAE